MQRQVLTRTVGHGETGFLLRSIAVGTEYVLTRPVLDLQRAPDNTHVMPVHTPAQNKHTSRKRGMWSRNAHRVYIPQSGLQSLKCFLSQGLYHSENIYTRHMLNEKRHIHLAKYRKHHEHYSKIFTAFKVTTTATEYTECR